MLATEFHLLLYTMYLPLKFFLQILRLRRVAINQDFAHSLQQLRARGEILRPQPQFNFPGQ